MLKYVADYKYIESNGTRLFTVVLLPEAQGRFPTVLLRSPYVDINENETEEVVRRLNEYKVWLERGYAIVFQHCRGRGKSDGDCIPYINEREDGLALQAWVRTQPFYNGELFLKGTSYLSSVHYATAPFAEDIKGACFGVQDSERYNICYRNGFLKKALHGNWYVIMYNVKPQLKKHYNYTGDAFNLLPLKDFTKTVFDEAVEDFDALLKAPDRENEFWSTRFGGSDARNATDNAQFPILFTTGFYDIYTGGVFDMWNQMHEASRNRSALLVSPYDHGDSCDAQEAIVFPKGKRVEQFGEHYELDWFDYIRGKTETAPFALGAVSYYNLFKNCWETDKTLRGAAALQLRLGEQEVSYKYNPYDAPTFKGGLSRCFGGTVYQDAPNSRHDIISVYTAPFEQDVQVKGKMTASLCVKSDCEDTCFYVRISIEKERGDYGLRDDITSLCHQLGDYTPNSMVTLDFAFDEHAFLIRKGERLRVDIASADNAHYVRHTNQKGLYSEQTTAKVACNTVDLKNSFLTLPVEQ